MESRKRSNVWRWVWGILIGLTLTVVVTVGLVAVAVVVGVVKLGEAFSEAFSSDTVVTIRPATVKGRVEFEMTYGKDVVGLAVFVVQDADGNELWKFSGGEGKPPKVVYGVIPTDPVAKWKQEFPADGSPPVDIRGKHIKIEANCRYIIGMGAGHNTSRTEYDVPR